MSAVALGSEMVTGRNIWKVTTNRIAICHLLAGLFAAIVFLSDGAHAQSRLSYKIVEEWAIPNGGFGRTIVVNKVHPTEAELRSLGQKLTQYTKSEGTAYIFVYDDERAARNRLAAFREELTEAETRYHDRHAVAVYARNAETGFHQFRLHPKGLDGPAVIVPY
jgi:DNA-binding LacI/PurR family transcriptional regulator